MIGIMTVPTTWQLGWGGQRNGSAGDGVFGDPSEHDVAIDCNFAATP
jgi:hypothetical protein